MDPREQIKAKVDIVPFIQEFIPLKQMGRNFKALCPFHGEKTPSFVVSPERQIWHCFGCGKGGDCFTFLMEFEKMDFVEALRTLAKRAGVVLPTYAPTQTDQLKDRLLGINHLSSEFYHYILTSHTAGEKAMEYLTSRGIKKKTIETFTLGFAPAKWDLLLSFLTKKKGFSPGDIEAAGLIIKSQKFYDRFRNRIMFTLRDHRGNVVGFAGRLLDPDAKEAKYVNTPETELYHKGELLFGLDVTKEAIKKEDQAIIVEGEFDMLQSFQEGVSNIVALKGTALTQSQAKLIRRFTQNIALSFDVDIAGDAAARRGIEIAENEGLNIKVIQVKEAKDPDEMIRKNPVAWKKAIKEAVSVYDFLIDSALSRYDPKTVEGEKGITNDVLPQLSSIGNEIVKAHFVKRLATLLDVSEEAILRQMAKIQKQIVSSGRTQKSESVKLSPLTHDRRDLLEEYLLALLLQKGDRALVQKMETYVQEGLIQNTVHEKIASALVTFYEKASSFAIASFVKDLPPELLPTIDRLYLLDTEAIKPENLSVELENVIRELRVLLLRKQMRDITATMRQQEQTSSEKNINTLKQTFNSLSHRLSELTQAQRA